MLNLELLYDIKFSKLADLLHKKACEENKWFYKDPDTGYTVMTKKFLLERGYCCNSKCRHCPYKNSGSNPAGWGTCLENKHGLKIVGGSSPSASVCLWY